MWAVRFGPRPVWVPSGSRSAGSGGCCIELASHDVRRPPGAVPLERSLLVLDIVYVLGVIILFSLVGLIGKAVDKL